MNQIWTSCCVIINYVSKTCKTLRIQVKEIRERSSSLRFGQYRVVYGFYCTLSYSCLVAFIAFTVMLWKEQHAQSQYCLSMMHSYATQRPFTSFKETISSHFITIIFFSVSFVTFFVAMYNLYLFMTIWINIWY